MVINWVEKFEFFLVQYTDKNNGKKYLALLKELMIQDKNSLLIDFDDLLNFDSELAIQLINNPRELISKAIEAIKNIKNTFEDYNFKPIEILPRFYNLGEKYQINLENIRAEYMGKLITIKGVVSVISDVIKRLEIAAIECEKCKGVFFQEQDNKEYKEPKKCEINTCRKDGPFKLLHVKSKFVNERKIKIEQFTSLSKNTMTSRPIDVILTGGLTDKANLDDYVIIIGYLEPSRKKRKDFDYVLIANNIEILDKENEAFLTSIDEKRILALSKNCDVNELISNSIIPSFCGDYTLKETLACFLFGGINRELLNEKENRGSIHLLLIGVPELIKTQLFEDIQNIVPGYSFYYKEGLRKSELGIPTLKNNEFKSEYISNNFVKADQGFIFINNLDELDTNGQLIIKEVMERQIINPIDKQSSQTFEARISLLATAQYLRKINDVLLSEFDLIYIFVNKEPSESRANINPDLLKKYIKLARKSSNPQLKEDSSQKIQDFAIKLQGIKNTQKLRLFKNPKISEKLVRIAKSQARMALRKEITLEDAENAIRIYSNCLGSFFNLEFNNVEDLLSKINEPITIPRNRILELEKIINELVGQKGGPVSTDDILEAAKSRGFEKDFVVKGLDDLDSKGIFFKPYRDYWIKS